MRHGEPMTASEHTAGLRGARPPKGFTIIEVLVTIAIIAIGSIGVLYMQTSSMRAGSKADQDTVAAFLAESRLEALRGILFTDVPVGTTTMLCTREGVCCEKTDGSSCVGTNPATSEPFPSFPYEIVTNVIAGQPTSFSNRIEIQISWKDVYGHRSLHYDAAVTNFSF